MSNMCKSMAKKVETPKMTFPTSMYNTPIGSLIVCGYIFTDDKSNFDVKGISSLWKKIEKNPLKYITFGLDDENFIDKCFDLFKIKRPEDFPIAMVVSKFNMLFVPYIDGKTYPVREDGFIPYTLNVGKVYPINFDKEA